MLGAHEKGGCRRLVLSELVAIQSRSPVKAMIRLSRLMNTL
jgi:hypothetical protein